MNFEHYELALKGVECWNEDKPLNPDLSNADLRGANLCKADLQEANLLGANLCKGDLQGANLRGADLRGTKLEGTILDKTEQP